MQIEGVRTENTTAEVHVISVFGQLRGRGGRVTKSGYLGEATVCQPCLTRLYKPEEFTVRYKGGEGPLARACVTCYKCGATRIYGLQKSEPAGGVF